MLACVERVPAADTVASVRQLMRGCIARRTHIGERCAELGACTLVCLLGARYFGQRDLMQ